MSGIMSFVFGKRSGHILCNSSAVRYFCTALGRTGSIRNGLAVMIPSATASPTIVFSCTVRLMIVPGEIAFCPKVQIILVNKGTVQC